jgi:epoxyqueuosine reductase QueG
MPLTSADVKEKAHSLGFDLCGIASVERFSDMPVLSNPASILPSCRSVIVVARKFLSGTTRAASTIPYTIIRNHLSRTIDEMTVDLSYFLEDRGMIGLPTGAIEPCNYSAELQKTMGLISLKNAAHQAGLGVIGKNTLLITPPYGNMVWLGAVLTDAQLEPDPILQQSPCRTQCRLCLEACPVGALDGSLFMDQKKCWNYAFGSENGGEWRIKCFKCRAICPYSRGFKVNRGNYDDASSASAPAFPDRKDSSADASTRIGVRRGHPPECVSAAAVMATALTCASRSRRRCRSRRRRSPDPGDR